MIVHLLKLVWRRKRANALVMAEIFLSFLIVFVVVTMTVSLLSRWRKPLGFDWREVWMVDIATPGMERVQAVIREAQSLPQVEAAAADTMTPYSESSWTIGMNLEGREVMVTADRASDDFARVMRIPLLKGRWFSREDDGQNYQPIVIDTDAARALFGTDEPLGKTFSGDYSEETHGAETYRVVGIIPPYRKDGELSENDVKVVFFRASFLKSAPVEVHAVIRVRPGTPASFEATLADRLRLAGGVSIRIKRLEDMRRLALKERFVPVVALSLVALFLISMVTLGLTGVLWQTVTRRMREMGIRRAVGATGRGVRMQVLAEVALLATFSVILGAIVIVQLPLLGMFRVITPAEFSTGFSAALVVIYGITLLCGGYPSWLASTIEPAEALRYE